jgi:hypothetical protein
MIWLSFGLSFVPFGLFIFASLLGTRWKPTAIVLSFVQHLAAGVVAAAVAVELLPIVVAAQQAVPRLWTQTKTVA